MMDGSMDGMMGGMMGAGVLIALLVVAVLIAALAALVRLIMPASEKRSAVPASALIAIAVVAGMAVLVLLGAAGWCGGMMGGVA